MRDVTKNTNTNADLTDSLDLSVAGNGDKGNTITVEVTPHDGIINGTTVSAPATVANSAPTISDITDQAIFVNTSTSALAFTVSDADNDALMLAGSSANTTLVPNSSSNITFGGSGASRTVTVTPAANQTGTAQITVTVSDPDSASANDLFNQFVGNQVSAGQILISEFRLRGVGIAGSNQWLMNSSSCITIPIQH